MPILRIEHPVPDFNAWKKAFDNDPVDRKGSGVRLYRVLRAADDPNYVMIASSSRTQARPRRFTPPCASYGAESRQRA